MVASFAWGLGVATVFACAIFAAITARLLPAPLLFGAIAIPRDLLSRGYWKKR